MPTYPTLSQNPELPIIMVPIFDTSILRYEGKVEQRQANWPQEKLQFRYRYKGILTADKALLWDFWNAVNGPHKKFDWTNPEPPGLVYTVKFKMKKLVFRYAGKTIWAGITEKMWDTGEIILIEA